MKLYDLLRTITHQNYTVILQDINFMNATRKLETIEEIKDHLDYTVVTIDENWTITIKGEKIA